MMPHVVTTWVELGMPVLLGTACCLWRRFAAPASLILVGLAVWSAWLGIATGAWAQQYGALAFSLSAVAFWLSPSYLDHQLWPERRRAAYWLLLGVFVGSLVSLGQAWPLAGLWVGVELTTLSSVALVAFSVGKRPFEAAWKYLAIAEFGGLLGLGGILLAQAPGGHLWPAGLLLALVGLGAKAGIAPFHNWLPDAHSEAPAPVSALLSGVELAGVLVVLRRVLTLEGHGAAWPHDVLLGMGLLSMAVGVALIPLQNNLKRLLAYSSVEHMGVIAAGFGFGGVAAVGALLHVFTHGLAKAQAFYLSGSIQTHMGTVNMRRIGRLHRQMPWTAGGMIVAGAALGGLPPFGPFWSEWLVVLGGISTPHMMGEGIATLLLLTAGLFGFAYSLPRMWTQRDRGGTRLQETAGLAVPAALMSALTVVSGLLVPLVYQWHL